MDKKIYEALSDDKELIELLYTWFRFPDEKLHSALRAAIPKINQFYPEEKKVTVFRGYRRQRENKLGHLIKRNSNWNGIDIFKLEEGRKFNLKIDRAMSFSRNEYTAAAFTLHGKDKLIIETEITLPSENYLVYTEEIYRAILMRYHIQALIAPGMEEIVVVPPMGKKVILPCTVKMVKRASVRDW